MFAMPYFGHHINTTFMRTSALSNTGYIWEKMTYSASYYIYIALFRPPSGPHLYIF
jgi:hypothetical protein